RSRDAGTEPRTQRSGVSGVTPTAYSASLRARLLRFLRAVAVHPLPYNDSRERARGERRLAGGEGKRVLGGAQGAPVADLGFAQVDLHRKARCGFPEVIFCQGKTPVWVEGVVRQLVAVGQDCLATRVSPEQAQYLAAVFPQAELDPVARTFWL